MEITKMISELRVERESIEQAIIALERGARGSGKRRGRPPKWMSDHTQATRTAESPKRVFSAQTRRGRRGKDGRRRNGDAGRRSETR